MELFSIKNWSDELGEIGLFTKSVRYGGGIYAHIDIAFEFASWISPEFKLYIIKDYQRLKSDENSRLSLNWNLNREIAKLNYRIHTDAIKENLVPPELTLDQISYKYANLIEQGKTMSERLVLLRELAMKQRETLSVVSMDAIKRLPGGEA